MWLPAPSFSVSGHSRVTRPSGHRVEPPSNTRRRPVARCLSLLHTPTGRMRQIVETQLESRSAGRCLSRGALRRPVCASAPARRGAHHPRSTRTSNHAVSGRRASPTCPCRPYGFVQGIATVCLYAAIRPRFGAGPSTAAIAALSVWFLTSWMHVVWAVFTAVPIADALVPLVVNLPLVVLSGLAGAWLYRE